MFVDASALVTMLTDEIKARQFAKRLQTSAQRLTVPAHAVEATADLAARAGLSPEKAGEILTRFLEAMAIRIVSQPAQLVPLAGDALLRYGQGPDRPDGLSPGECLTYAAARYYRLPLLTDDPRFAETDVELG